MTARSYLTPQAFKQALEQHLRATAASGAAFSRNRQLLVFDRFLARIVAVFDDAVILKGGLALELRLERARTTRDVDLMVMGTPNKILSQLQEAARRDLNDFMTYEVGEDQNHPVIQNDGMQYEGLRFRATCKVAGRLFGQPFGVDVVFGEPLFGKPDVLVGNDVLDFAGIAAPLLRIIPIETHIAEKLHAYTMPRSRPNSRVKDLPDIALLATDRTLEASRVRAALEQTFKFRNTHALPAMLPEPQRAWVTPYAAMAREDRLAWRTLDEVTAAARSFLDPVLAQSVDGIWAPELWRWRPK
jgi:Nucleotidyl transferase AbiEii toxin, Type IV TA system